jgi:hypothetical protein
MTDEELIARLRGAGKHPMMDGNCKVDVYDVHDAADRIEALVKELDDVTINRAAWELEAKIQQAEVARFEEMSMLDFANYQTAKSLRRIQSMKGESYDR